MNNLLAVLTKKISSFAPEKFFTLFHQTEKVTLNCALIGNLVKIQNCRATVSNKQRFILVFHCPVQRMGRTINPL